MSAYDAVSFLLEEIASSDFLRSFVTQKVLSYLDTSTFLICRGRLLLAICPFTDICGVE